MNSNFSDSQSSDGHFPYGNQRSYRDFIMPQELEKSFLQLGDRAGLEDDPLVLARYFYPA